MDRSTPVLISLVPIEVEEASLFRPFCPYVVSCINTKLMKRFSIFVFHCTEDVNDAIIYLALDF